MTRKCVKPSVATANPNAQPNFFSEQWMEPVVPRGLGVLRANVHPMTELQGPQVDFCAPDGA